MLLKTFQILLQTGLGRGHANLQGQNLKWRMIPQYFQRREDVGIPSRRRQATASQTPRDGALSYLIKCTQTVCPLSTIRSCKNECFLTAMYFNRRNAKGSGAITSLKTTSSCHRGSNVACQEVSKAYSRTQKGPGTLRLLRLIAPRARPSSRNHPSIDILMATTLDVDTRIVVPESVVALVDGGSFIFHLDRYVFPLPASCFFGTGCGSVDVFRNHGTV